MQPIQLKSTNKFNPISLKKAINIISMHFGLLEHEILNPLCMTHVFGVNTETLSPDDIINLWHDHCYDPSTNRFDGAA